MESDKATDAIERIATALERIADALEAEGEFSLKVESAGEVISGQPGSAKVESQ